MPGMDDRGETTESRRGVLEPCVLALLAERPRFGLELVRDLSEADGLLTSQGTVYPLLNRLRDNGLVTSSGSTRTRHTRAGTTRSLTGDASTSPPSARSDPPSPRVGVLLLSGLLVGRHRRRLHPRLSRAGHYRRLSHAGPTGHPGCGQYRWEPVPKGCDPVAANASTAPKEKMSLAGGSTRVHGGSARMQGHSGLVCGPVTTGREFRAAV
jgi:DNA-binding transcriptional ArsR family regulator